MRTSQILGYRSGARAVCTRPVVLWSGNLPKFTDNTIRNNALVRRKTRKNSKRRLRLRKATFISAKAVRSFWYSVTGVSGIDRGRMMGIMAVSFRYGF
jgi:hypothetical protein